MKVFFLSLGCDKNLSDAEHMLSILAEAGYEFTDLEEEAEVIIVNSCCFIGDAKEESISEILRLSAYKGEGCLKALIVTGCLSERYQKELMTELPEVDGALGIGSWDRIADVVADALNKKHPELYLPNDRLVCTENRMLTTGGHYAYLKIAEGCDKNCTYCIIPKVRGHYRSVPMETLLKEAEDLVVNKGVKELILVAQETTIYGMDLYGRKALPELLEKLNAIEDLKWIRILYCYPEEVTPELMETMKKCEKVVHYLDIPVQHASDRILRRMNRRTNRAELTEKIRMMRETVPDIRLRTTLITGFPGETEEDFKEMESFVEEIEFDRLGVFTYSQEEDTPAAEFEDQIDEDVKKERRDVIMEIQQEIAFRHAEDMEGREVDVMIEGRVTDEDDVYVGRTYMDAPDVDGFIFLNTSYDLMSGDFVRALVTGASEYDLIGEIIE